jgi:hypothetical protein
MRKYIHTSIVILCLLTGVAHGQFSAIWTNGDLFATEQMASQCYSASVERCVAVGITPDEPSWWDYITGKNRAKLLSVKNNIKSVINWASYGHSFFIKPESNMFSAITNGGPLSVRFDNNSDFSAWCGLPTNALDETPYFKSQYASTTGGWRNVMVMLTNLVATSFQSVGDVYNPGSWETNIDVTLSFALGYGRASFGYSETYDSAYGIATNWGYLSYCSFSPFPFAYSESARTTDEFYPYAVFAHSTYGKTGYWGVATNIGHSASAYLISGEPPPEGFSANIYDPAINISGYPTNYNKVFDVQGSPPSLIATNWLCITNFDESFLSSQTVTIGEYSDEYTSPQMVSFPSEPSVDSVNLLGWAVKDNITVLWWNGTNGFKYK